MYKDSTSSNDPWIGTKHHVKNGSQTAGSTNYMGSNFATICYTINTKTVAMDNNDRCS
jgi:hypothetical protein